MNKEISASLHFLLHCSLNDARFETQREQFEFIYKYIENLVKENQELKLELSGYRQAILEDKDMLGLKEESEELKKQLTTYKILHRDCKVDNLKNISKIEEMETQQKEFIEYLEKEILDSRAGSGQQYYAQEHLKMFEEIIGGNKDEK